jgi:hypothetical protein
MCMCLPVVSVLILFRVSNRAASVLRDSQFPLTRTPTHFTRPFLDPYSSIPSPPSLLPLHLHIHLLGMRRSLCQSGSVEINSITDSCHLGYRYVLQTVQYSAVQHTSIHILHCVCVLDNLNHFAFKHIRILHFTSLHFCFYYFTSLYFLQPLPYPVSFLLFISFLSSSLLLSLLFFFILLFSSFLLLSQYVDALYGPCSVEGRNRKSGF